MSGSWDTREVGVRVVLRVDGRQATLADPAGGTFDAAGDFDRLLPVSAEAFPVLSRIDPFGEVRIPTEDLSALASEVDSLLEMPIDGAERRGLLRLRELATKGQTLATSELRFVGD